MFRRWLYIVIKICVLVLGHFAKYFDKEKEWYLLFRCSSSFSTYTCFKSVFRSVTHTFSFFLQIWWSAQLPTYQVVHMQENLKCWNLFWKCSRTASVPFTLNVLQYPDSWFLRSTSWFWGFFFTTAYTMSQHSLFSSHPCWLLTSFFNLCWNLASELFSILLLKEFFAENSFPDALKQFKDLKLAKINQN